MSLHICILRLSSLGDISHVLPVLHALLQTHPECRIDWIIDPRHQALIPDLPGLTLLTYDKRGGRAAISALRQQLASRYDVLLQLQTSLRANLLSLMIRADRRIGWDRIRQREGHRWCCNETIAEHAPQHQVQGFLAFARHLGCAVHEPHWPIRIAAADQAFATQMLPGEQALLGISPCSSHPLRNWHAAGYAAVAAHAIRSGMRVCLLGGPGDAEQRMGTAIEQQLNETMGQADHRALCNLIGRDSPTRMLALLQRCDVLLSPDSGPAHWASALGTPVIGLHAATWSRRSGPYHSLHLCVDRFEQAAQQFRHKTAAQLRWGTRIEVPGVMDLIGVDEVVSKLEKAVKPSENNHSSD
ncbi:MAG: glycosyltransferase family 9 protein [Wenzhouxiangellaceae bacterium]